MQGVEANNKRIFKNTIFLYVRMLFVLIVSLYTSRVVMNTLGVSDYGVFNVVAGFVSMFGFLNATLSSSMSRFYNYEGGIRGEEGVREVYISGFYVHVVIAICVFVLLETFGIWYINNVMVVPVDRLNAARIVFHFSVISLLIVILQIPYTSAIMSYEHMDFYAFVSIIDVVLKLILVIILTHLHYDKLIIFSLFSVIPSLVSFLLFFFYTKKHFKAVSLEKRINRGLFKQFLSFSGWNLVGSFAYLLKGQGLNMVLNVFFGPLINAARGVAYQVNGAVSGFSQNISTSFRPQIVDSFSKGDSGRTKMLMFTESKVCYCLILILITPLIIAMDYVLSLWLGEAVPEYANIFTSLLLIDLLICTLNTPCSQVAFAVGNIKWYQIVSSLINLMLLPVCWLFLKLGFSAVSSFTITIVFSCINQIGCLLVLNHMFSFGLIHYLKQVLFPCMAITVLLPVVPLLFYQAVTHTFVSLVLVVLIDLAIAAPLVHYVLLNKTERQLARGYFNKLFYSRRVQ